MTILSWNVNGLRAVIKKDFHGFLQKHKPDILCLQEIKIDTEAIRLAEFDFPGYTEFYNPAERKGYSGTAILARNIPRLRSVSAPPSKGELIMLPKLSWDDEGRIQVLDIGKVYLVNVYFPNANHELSRLDFKMKFNDRLLKHFKALEKKKPLIVCGDFNVAHEEIDLARPKENVGSPGFTDEERAWMTRFLKAGYVDTFRKEHPKKVQYSWWSYRMGARARNVGWRIDYFCITKKHSKNIKSSFIMDTVPGSDHAPVGIIIGF